MSFWDIIWPQEKIRIYRSYKKRRCYHCYTNLKWRLTKYFARDGDYKPVNYCLECGQIEEDRRIEAAIEASEKEIAKIDNTLMFKIDEALGLPTDEAEDRVNMKVPPRITREKWLEITTHKSEPGDIGQMIREEIKDAEMGIFYAASGTYLPDFHGYIKID
jgi:hypothetical protein